MFVVTEAQAAMIRATYEQRGEFSAAVELRRLFPGITNLAQARECVRTIAGWQPMPSAMPRALPNCGWRIQHALNLNLIWFGRFANGVH